MMNLDLKTQKYKTQNLKQTFLISAADLSYSLIAQAWLRVFIVCVQSEGNRLPQHL